MHILNALHKLTAPSAGHS